MATALSCALDPGWFRPQQQEQRQDVWGLRYPGSPHRIIEHRFKASRWCSSRDHFFHCSSSIQCPALTSRAKRKSFFVPSLHCKNDNRLKAGRDDRSRNYLMNGPIASSNICWEEGIVTKQERRELLQQKGCIIWLTGLSGSGKSTVAFNVDKVLTSMGKVSYVLDGDNVRHGLCKNLGFSAADRAENMRRVGETARLFLQAGLITLVSLISPFKQDRDFVRQIVQKGEFIEVYMNVPLETCEQRDCKGLYKRARAGIIKGFTGIDDPYERPVSPEISLKDTSDHGAHISAEEMAWTVVRYLSDNGYLSS